MVRSRNATYRALFVVLFLKGVATGGYLPFLAVWASRDLQASALEVGLLRTLSGVGGFAFGVTAALATDRTQRRRNWILGAMCIETLALAALGRATTLESALPILLLATSVGGVGLLFANVGDQIRADAKSPNVLHNTMRMAVAAGWAAGPAVASFVVARTSLHTLFLFSAAASLAAFLVAAFFLTDAPSGVQRKLEAPPRGRIGAIAVVTAALSLAFGADVTARSTLLPIYVTRDLDASVTWFGMMLSCGVVLELPAFLVGGTLADRWGSRALLVGGFSLQAIAYAVLAFVPNKWAVAAVEPIHVIFVVCLHGTAMARMQSLLPHRVGLSMALFSATMQLAPACTAPALSVVAERGGWATAFALCAVGLAVAALLMRRVPHP